ncbi:hypothetical protein K492DRAFT_209245 [Lichtheimia hyalospora FSU 10163]|nr:hypothetical protein K492DRAFT_209245 [Lichtheimia hyalospora FSU 10163]
MINKRKRSRIVLSDDEEEERTDDESTDDDDQTRSSSSLPNKDRIAFDCILLEETLRVNPFDSPHGTKKYAWEKVADGIKKKRSLDGVSMTGVYVRNRVYYLMSTRPKTNTGIEQLRQKVIEAKNNGETSKEKTMTPRSSVSSSSDVLVSPNTPLPVATQQRPSLVVNHSATHAASSITTTTTSPRQYSDQQLEQRCRFLESRTQYLEQRTQFLEPRLSALETATSNLFALFSDHQQMTQHSEN